MSDRYPFAFFVEGARLKAIEDGEGPDGKAAIVVTLGDGSRLFAMRDDDPANPIGVRLEWVPGTWS